MNLPFIDMSGDFVDAIDMSDRIGQKMQAFIDMAFVSDRPFNDLPRLPPAKEIETKPILRACIEARAALAELKISGRLIPNQSF